MKGRWDGEDGENHEERLKFESRIFSSSWRQADVMLSAPLETVSCAKIFSSEKWCNEVNPLTSNTPPIQQLKRLSHCPSPTMSVRNPIVQSCHRAVRWSHCFRFSLCLSFEKKIVVYFFCCPALDKSDQDWYRSRFPNASCQAYRWPDDHNHSH